MLRDTVSSPAQLPATTQSLLLHESTASFVQRLRTRGYPINFPLRDLLAHKLEANKDHHQHPSTMWLKPDSHWTIRRKQLTPHPDATLPPEMYCALLCGLQDFQIDYINLSTVLYGMSVLEIRNFYRYCYLEWVIRHPNSPEHPSKTHAWPCTPREFKTLPVEELRVKWMETLQLLLRNEPPDDPDGTPVASPATGAGWSRRTRSLFFVNRLYSYLTPCG